MLRAEFVVKRLVAPHPVHQGHHQPVEHGMLMAQLRSGMAPLITIEQTRDARNGITGRSPTKR
jgi:hypothetical protein